MPADRLPRVLLTTAGFGDGHNSATRNLARSLEGLAEPLIVDPCAEGAPLLNESLRFTYRAVTTRAPWLWHRIYRGVEKRDFSRQQVPFMRLAENALTTRIKEFDPTVIVSTYPLYPYFLERHFREGGRRRPVFTVVTDSIEINAAWRRAPTSYWLVTDPETRRGLIESGLPEGKLVDTGFPVDPRFNDLQPLGADADTDPFRVLFFPTAQRPVVRRMARAILDSGDGRTELTIVMGRNLRRLYHRAREIKTAYPGRVRLLGWTGKVPELLCSHHLCIGKAGGATVHEALAARCPMLVHHLVPGQEERNLQLLRHLGGGGLADSPEAVSSSLRDLLADQGAKWRRQKQHLARHSRPNAAVVAARFILDHANEERRPY
jgi:processive 1,2-diacylglycerol beta-glucosyltransferase